jgi:hypothetical protein
MDSSIDDAVVFGMTGRSEQGRNTVGASVT